MIITPLQVLIGKWAAGLGVVLLAGSVCYFSGVSHGKEAVTAQWDKEKGEYTAEILKLTGKIQQQEFAHRQETVRISDELRKAEVEHEKTLAALRVEHADRLRLSSERAQVYQRLAEGGPDQLRGLAGHAAELDRSLEEGRGLVAEFQAALGQREAQLRLLGAQIINDRKLLDGQ